MAVVGLSLDDGDEVVTVGDDRGLNGNGGAVDGFVLI